MAKPVNPVWIKERKKEILEGRVTDITSSFNRAVQVLITLLVDQNIPYKIYNLGAGVKRLTTNTNICPLCKKTLKED